MVIICFILEQTVYLGLKAEDSNCTGSTIFYSSIVDIVDIVFIVQCL